MRPILKSSSGCMSQESLSTSSAASGSGIKRDDNTRSVSSASSRRVTFSPFAKTQSAMPSPIREHSPRQQSGRVAIAGCNLTLDLDKRRKKDWQLLKTLYHESRKRSYGVRMMLHDAVTAIQQIQGNVSRQLRQLLGDNYPAASRRPRRRLRRHLAWTEFDRVDHEYMVNLVRSQVQAVPQSHLSEHIAVQPRTCSRSAVDPQPDLTPACQGEFAHLLRSAGIAADSDDRCEQQAITDDLGGIRHRSMRLKAYGS